MRVNASFLLKHIPLLHKISKTAFWFGVGAFLGLFLLISFTFLLFQIIYRNVAYPGISIGNISVGGKTQAQITEELTRKNNAIREATFTFSVQGNEATISAQILHAGYDGNLLAQQAMSIGRSSDIFSNITLVFQAYITGISLSPSYLYNPEKIVAVLKPIQDKIKIDPVNAVFAYQNNKVTTFTPSSDGQDIDMQFAKAQVQEKIPYLLSSGKPQHFTISIPIKILHPKISTGSANSLGITELRTCSWTNKWSACCAR